jgi:hypothetical protein
MARIVKIVAETRDVILSDGTCALGILFTDGDYTCLSRDRKDLKFAVGETVFVEIPEEADVPTFLH